MPLGHRVGGSAEEELGRAGKKLRADGSCRLRDVADVRRGARAADDRVADEIADRVVDSVEDPERMGQTHDEMHRAGRKDELTGRGARREPLVRRPEERDEGPERRRRSPQHAPILT